MLPSQEKCNKDRLAIEARKLTNKERDRQIGKINNQSPQNLSIKHRNKFSYKRQSAIQHNDNATIGEDDISPKNCKNKRGAKN